MTKLMETLIETRDNSDEWFVRREIEQCIVYARRSYIIFIGGPVPTR